jgi:hypothetical protein
MVSQSNTTNVPETALDAHVTANGERPVQEQPEMTDTPEVA